MPTTSSQTFDYGAARKAGFSDEQIAAHLAAKRAAGVNVTVDRSEVQAVRAGGTDPTTMTAEVNPLTMFTLGARNRALSLLPMAGGIAGTAIGSPGGLLGASVGSGIGGAAGEGAREALMGEPLSAKKIGLEGAVQGAATGVGGLALKGAGKLATHMMHRATGAGKSILSRNPDAIETVLKKGFSVSEKGAAQAKAARVSSSRTLKELLAKSDAAGIKLSTADVTKYVRERLRDKAIPTSEKQSLFRQFLEFRGDQGRNVKPSLLKDIKQRSQRIAKGTYVGDPSSESARVLFNKELARGAKEQLETIPGVAAREAETRSLIGAQKATSEAIMRPPRAFEVQKPSTYPVIGMAVSPGVTSRLAIQLAKPGVQEALRQSPRLAAELIQQLMYSDEPDATAMP